MWGLSDRGPVHRVSTKLGTMRMDKALMLASQSSEAFEHHVAKFT